jgi:N-acetylglucosamine malate deacetylase 2
LKILYIFPHPDDESFGPAAAMHAQLKQGHEVYLLTLTKGGATQQRFKLGVSVEEMGEIRYKEMQEVRAVLGLTGMTVLDFPDSRLKELDPRVLEKTIKNHIENIQPEIVITYPVHGISGFHDHLITHAVVKQVFLEMKDSGADYLRRLAFFTIPDSGEPSMMNGKFRLKHTEKELIDCIYLLQQDNIESMKKALSCYETYKATIEATGVIKQIGDRVYFEIFMENHKPELKDITENLC